MLFTLFAEDVDRLGQGDCVEIRGILPDTKATLHIDHEKSHELVLKETCDSLLFSSGGDSIIIALMYLVSYKRVWYFLHPVP